MICNGKFKGRTLVRAILFLPIIMNAGAINNAIEMAREAVTGGVAAVSAEAAVASGVNVDYFMNLFMDLGFPVALLDYITAAVGRIFDIVQASGVQIIIFIAALQSVPGALYEVAKIEGATGYETFWKVTFPMVSPLIITNVVYTIVDSFVDSDVVEKAYDMAFVNFDWGVRQQLMMRRQWKNIERAKRRQRHHADVREVRREPSGERQMQTEAQSCRRQEKSVPN